MTTNPGTWVAAVDLGASSVRVCVCNLDGERLSYDVVHRVAHEPVARRDGVLRWDWQLIRGAVIDGLELARDMHPLASIGIDTWAVDYGLIDADGMLLADPACYRDQRTANYQTLVDRIGAKRLFEINGLQTLPINTIFQLHAEDTDLLSRARHILTLPELLVHDLTGTVTAETTSAGSTGLVDQQTRNWSPELLDSLPIDLSQLPAIAEPGTPVGAWNGIPVHLVAGHDTASAVVGIHATEPNPFFVSSGTWILAGQELDRPVLTAAARRALFTNEYGPERTTRFLKNIAGFWIVEECRRRWGTATTAELLTGAQGVEIPDVLFDATDPRFLAPANMEAEVLDAVGVDCTTSRSATVGIIVNSLASTTAYVISEASALTGTSVSRVHIIGGGNRSVQFVERLRKAVGTEIVVGAEESAALGNAIVQGLSLGRWADLTSARSALAP